MTRQKEEKILGANTERVVSLKMVFTHPQGLPVNGHLLKVSDEKRAQPALEQKCSGKARLSFSPLLYPSLPFAIKSISGLR